MARVKRAVNAHKKRRDDPRAGQRLPRSAVAAVPQGQGAGHPLAGLRLPRPQEAQGRLPSALDPADQRRGPRQRHDLQPVHPGPEGRRCRGRPPDARRARRQRRGRVHRAGRGRARRRCRPTSTRRGLTAADGARTARCATAPGRCRRVNRARDGGPAAAPGAPRDRERPFLAEGPQAVREALAAAGRARPPIPELFVTAEAAGRAPRRPGAAAARGRRPGARRRRRGPRRSGRHGHPAGHGRRLPLPGRAADRRPARRAGRALVRVLVHARDPGNAGTVIRTADAAGAGAVVLTDAQRRPLQRQVRARLGRQPVPPAGRDRRRASSDAVAGAARGRAARARRRRRGRRDLDGRRRRAAGRAHRLAVRQRGVGAAGRRRARWPTPSSGCRSTARPRASTSPPPPRSASTPPPGPSGPAGLPAGPVIGTPDPATRPVRRAAGRSRRGRTRRVRHGLQRGPRPGSTGIAPPTALGRPLAEVLPLRRHARPGLVGLHAPYDGLGTRVRQPEIELDAAGPRVPAGHRVLRPGRRAAVARWSGRRRAARAPRAATAPSATGPSWSPPSPTSCAPR